MSRMCLFFVVSSEDDSDCESKPSYKTLAKIATEQQKAMEHIQKLLDKTMICWALKWLDLSP